MRYAIVIEKAPSNYAAYVPDLPGCIATGASVQETESLIREAIEFHLESLREDGQPKPIIDTQLCVDRGEMVAHCRLTDHQLLRDRLVPQSLADELNDLALTLSQ